MSANISIKNGMAEMMYTGAMPWHKLGTEVSGLQTSREALKAAHLDWTVELRDIFIRPKDNVGEPIQAARHKATVRTDEDIVLGVVGNQYAVLQNERAFDFFDALVGDDQAIFETAGALDDGRQVWMLAKVGHVMEILPGDLVQQYCLLVHSHDGSKPVQLRWTPIRVVCSNTLAMAMDTGTTIASLKHTRTIEGRIKEAGVLLRKSYEHLDKLGASAAEFANCQMSDQDVDEFTDRFVGMNEVFEDDDVSSRAYTIRSKKKEDILNIYYGEQYGMDIDGVRGTTWGAYNAATAYVNHVAVNNTRGNGNAVKSLFFGTGLDQNMKAFNMAKAYVEQRA